MGWIEIGVVLAGGRSERMGTPKAGLKVDGETFLDRAVGTLRSRFPEVIVAGGRFAPPDATLVPDREPGRGPLGGIASAVAFAQRDVLVVPVDLPHLSSDVPRKLAERPLLPGQVRVARSTGRIHPLVAAFPFDQLDLMEAHLASGDRSVIGFLRSVPVLSPIDVDAVALTDVNTPQDLQDFTATT